MVSRESLGLKEKRFPVLCSGPGSSQSGFSALATTSVGDGVVSGDVRLVALALEFVWSQFTIVHEFPGWSFVVPPVSSVLLSSLVGARGQ